MRINELAKRTGVSARNIRFYEESGLLPEAARSGNGYRDYSDQDVEQLLFIRRCRDLQIPLQELKTLVRLKADELAPCDAVDRVIQEQLQQVRQKQQELAILEQQLLALASDCSNNRIADCRIIERLRMPNLQAGPICSG